MNHNIVGALTDAGSWPLVDLLPPNAATALMTAGRPLWFERGETIVSNGALSPPVYLLAQGRVGIELTSASGPAGLLDLVGPYGSVGDTTLNGTGHLGRAVALDDTKTIVISRARFEQFRVEHPAFDAEVARRIARWADHLASRLLAAWFEPAETRVLRCLADLTARAIPVGEDSRVPQPVTLALTQEDLAMLTGCRRPTVNRALAEASRLDLLTVSRGAVTITDPDRLIGHRHPR